MVKECLLVGNFFFVNLKLPQGCHVLPRSLWYCLVFCNVYLCPLNVTVKFMSIQKKPCYSIFHFWIILATHYMLVDF